MFSFHSPNNDAYVINNLIIIPLNGCASAFCFVSAKPSIQNIHNDEQKQCEFRIANANHHRAIHRTSAEHQTGLQLASGAILHSFEHPGPIWNCRIVHQYLLHNCDIHRATDAHGYNWSDLWSTSAMGPSDLQGEHILENRPYALPNYGRPGMF